MCSEPDRTRCSRRRCGDPVPYALVCISPGGGRKVLNRIQSGIPLGPWILVPIPGTMGRPTRRTFTLCVRVSGILEYHNDTPVLRGGSGQSHPISRCRVRHRGKKEEKSCLLASMQVWIRVTELYGFRSHRGSRIERSTCSRGYGG